MTITILLTLQLGSRKAVWWCQVVHPILLCFAAVLFFNICQHTLTFRIKSIYGFQLEGCVKRKKYRLNVMFIRSKRVYLWIEYLSKFSKVAFRAIRVLRISRFDDRVISLRTNCDVSLQSVELIFSAVQIVEQEPDGDSSSCRTKSQTSI